MHLFLQCPPTAAITELVTSGDAVGSRPLGADAVGPLHSTVLRGHIGSRRTPQVRVASLASWSAGTTLLTGSDREGFLPALKERASAVVSG